MIIKRRLTCVESAYDYVNNYISDEEWNNAFSDIHPHVSREIYLSQDYDVDGVDSLVEDWADFEIISKLLELKQEYCFLYTEYDEQGNIFFTIFEITLPEHCDQNNLSHFIRE